MKTTKEIKQKYFDRVYLEAPVVECACGCGMLMKSKDKYGRDKKFISGHNRRKYEDPSQYKREWNHRNRESRYVEKTQRIHKLKAELILNAGGKCSCCGFDFDGECTAVFDFHHIDPSTKKFNLNNSALNKYSKARIKEEAAKCELLCANCHRIYHWHTFNMANSQ
jgi:hypothetical protein